MSGGLYSRGAHLDTPHRKLGYKLSTWSTPPEPGTIYSLAEYQPPVFDQGGTASCEGHRAAMAIVVAQRARGVEPAFIPSPDAIYRDARCIARRAVNHVLPPLEDTGCMTGDVFTALGYMGIEPLGYSQEGRNSDCGADVNREPRLDELVSQANTLVTGEVALTIDKDIAGKILTHLEKGFPVGVDVWVDTAFERWGHVWDPALAPIESCDKGDPTGGWHAILITELETTTAGHIVVSGPNSWGEWGAPPLVGDQSSRGMWRASGEWLLKAADMAQVWSIK